MKNRIGPIFSCLVLASCAVAKFKNEINYFGEIDLDRGVAAEEKAKSMPWDQKYPVQVFVGTLPEGLSLSEGGSKLLVSPGYEKKFQILGTITSKYDREGPLRGLYWYTDLHEQHSKARDYYCKSQAPLRLLTLSIWSWLVPLNWPCLVTHPGKPEGLKLHIQELKRSAVAMGANLVILSSTSNYQGTVVTGTKTSVPLVSSYNIESAGVTGFAIKAKE